jgi:hypothetical protein
MGLFTFTDISVSDEERTYSNALDNPAQGYNVLRYPVDLGSTDKGHYMLLYINTQKRSKYDFEVDGNTPTNMEYNMTNLKNLGGIESILSSYNNVQRTKEAIALYIPDTLAFSNRQEFDAPNFGKNWKAAALTGMGSFQENMKARAGSKDQISGSARNASIAVLGAAAGILTQKDPFWNGAFRQLTGMVMNPMMEIIYQSPSMRKFSFEFKMYPRNVKEAQELNSIISKLKFHQAPEILKGSKGFFLVPPSTFDIEFFYNGQKNPNIESISTCVLESIDLDYAPNGWAAYEVFGEPTPSNGKTGMPVVIGMTLSFLEMEYMTKENYAASAGYGEQTTSTPETQQIQEDSGNPFESSTDV